MRRNIRIVVLCLVVALIALLAWQWRSGRDDSDTTRPQADPRGSTIVRAPATTPAIDPDATARADATARENAMRDAVSTVHRYLTALGTGDPAKSDPFWSGGRPPRTRNEADLPTLDGLRSLRIENGTPRALDGLPLPEALEIPVTLRAGMKDAPARRYEGYYRLRRTLDKRGWELTSARVDVAATPQ